MAAPAIDLSALEGLDREPATPGEVNESPRLCRVTLAKTATAPIELRWHPGKGTGVRSNVTLKPGESCVDLLAKVEVWFGPFTTPERYANTTDERKREALQKFWRVEKKRVLDRYDYPRVGGKDGDMTPTGPHRFPDITVTVIESDGTEMAPICLHELYRIGEFDTVTFAQAESAEDVRAEYEEKLAEKDASHAATMAEMRREVSALSGQLQGFIAGLKVPAASAAGAPAVAAEPTEKIAVPASKVK